MQYFLKLIIQINYDKINYKDMGNFVTHDKLSGPELKTYFKETKCSQWQITETLHQQEEKYRDMTKTMPSLEKAHLPLNFWCVNSGLYVGGVPVERHSLKILEDVFNVGLIVTCISSPLTRPRLFNCVKDTEFCDRDPHMFDGITSKLDFLHLPILDGDCPTSYQTDEFLNKCKLAMDKGKNIFVHCWAGSRRSWTMCCIFMRYFYAFTQDQLKTRFSPATKMNDWQLEYFSQENGRFPKSPSKSHDLWTLAGQWYFLQLQTVPDNIKYNRHFLTRPFENKSIKSLGDANSLFNEKNKEIEFNRDEFNRDDIKFAWESEKQLILTRACIDDLEMSQVQKFVHKLLDQKIAFQGSMSISLEDRKAATVKQAMEDAKGMVEAMEISKGMVEAFSKGTVEAQKTKIEGKKFAVPYLYPSPLSIHPTSVVPIPSMPTIRNPIERFDRHEFDKQIIPLGKQTLKIDWYYYLFDSEHTVKDLLEFMAINDKIPISEISLLLCRRLQEGNTLIETPISTYSHDTKLWDISPQPKTSQGLPFLTQDYKFYGLQLIELHRLKFDVRVTRKTTIKQLDSQIKKAIGAVDDQRTSHNIKLFIDSPSGGKLLDEDIRIYDFWREHLEPTLWCANYNWLIVDYEQDGKKCRVKIIPEPSESKIEPIKMDLDPDESMPIIKIPEFHLGYHTNHIKTLLSKALRLDPTKEYDIYEFNSNTQIWNSSKYGIENICQNHINPFMGPHISLKVFGDKETPFPTADENGNVTMAREYGQVIGDKKTLERVEVFNCPRSFGKEYEEKKCRHSIYLYFTDGSHYMRSHEIEIEEFKKLAYLPFATIYKQEHFYLQTRQEELCDFAKIIPKEKHVQFLYLTNQPALKAKTGTDTIYYRFQSSTGVAEIFCTDCGLGQNYAYRSIGEVVAYWYSAEKKRVLCPLCATLVPETKDRIKELVPVHFHGDVPANRSLPLYEETKLWNDHLKNISGYSKYRFDFSEISF